MTSVGTISVEFGGDSSRLEAAQEKVRRALGGTGQAMGELGQAVGKSVGYADVFDRSGKRIASSADEAARTLDNKLTPAAERARAKLTQLGSAHDASVAPTRRSGAAILEVSRGLEDLQYGIGGVLNNIPNLVQMLGMGAGVAGVISLVAVGVTQLIKHWDDFAGATEKATKDAAESARKNLAALTDEITSLYDKINALGSGQTVEIVETKRRIDETKIAGMAAVPKGREEAFLAYAGSTKFRDPSVESVPEFAGARAILLENLKLQDKLHLLQNEVAGAEIKRLEDEVKAKSARDSARTGNAQEKYDVSSTRSDGVNAWMQQALKLQNGGNLTSSAFNQSATSPFTADVSLMDPDATRSSALTRGSDQYAASTAEFDRLSDPLEGSVTVISHAMDATADEIDAMNSDFMSAGEAAIDLRTPLERFGDALNDVDLKAISMDVAEATAKGGLSAGGVAAGTAVGGVIDVVTGGATGGLGAVLGGIIGGILGKALDELINVLGILTPLFDAVAVIISALAPIFVVLGVFVTSLAGTIIALVPLIASVAEPIAAILLVVVRLVSAILPFINILVIAVGVLVSFILEPIMIGAQKLDEGLRLMVSGALGLYNGFVDVYNALIGLIRNIPGFEEFGVTMAHVSTVVEDTLGGFAGSIEEITGIMDNVEGPPDPDPTGGASEGSGQNVPTGYRVPFYEAERPDGPGSAARGITGGIGSAARLIINGNVTVVAQNADIQRQIRDQVMRRRGTNQERSGGNDESN